MKQCLSTQIYWKERTRALYDEPEMTEKHKQMEEKRIGNVSQNYTIKKAEKEQSKQALSMKGMILNPGKNDH